MLTKSKTLFGLGAIVVALGLGACGSDDDSGGQGASAGSAGGSQEELVPSVDKAPANAIKIGTFTDIDSGTAGTSFEIVRSGVGAAIRAINASGGIHGRQIALDFCDTKANATQAEACAQQFISNKVDAVVGGYSTSGSPVISAALAQAKIPNFGVYGGVGEDFTAATNFVTGGASVTWSAGFMPALKSTGTNDAYMAYYGIAAGANLVKLAESGAKSAGVTWKGSTAIPPSAADYSPYVNTIKKAGVPYVLTALASTANIRVAQTAQSLGADFDIIFQGIGLNFLKDTPDLLNGSVTLNTYPAPNEETAKKWPAMRQFLDEMKAHADAGDEFATPDYFDPSQSVRPWVAMHVFADVLKEMPEDKIDPAGILEELNSTKELDNMGFSPPIDLTKSKFNAQPRLFNPWLYINGIEDGGLVLKNETPIDTAAIVNAY